MNHLNQSGALHAVGMVAQRATWHRDGLPRENFTQAAKEKKILFWTCKCLLLLAFSALVWMPFGCQVRTAQYDFGSWVGHSPLSHLSSSGKVENVALGSTPCAKERAVPVWKAVSRVWRFDKQPGVLLVQTQTGARQGGGSGASGFVLRTDKACNPVSFAVFDTGIACYDARNEPSFLNETHACVAVRGALFEQLSRKAVELERKSLSHGKGLAIPGSDAASVERGVPYVSGYARSGNGGSNPLTLRGTLHVPTAGAATNPCPVFLLAKVGTDPAIVLEAVFQYLHGKGQPQQPIQLQECLICPAVATPSPAQSGVYALHTTLRGWSGNLDAFSEPYCWVQDRLLPVEQPLNRCRGSAWTHAGSWLSTPAASQSGAKASAQGQTLSQRPRIKGKRRLPQPTQLRDCSIVPAAASDSELHCWSQRAASHRLLGVEQSETRSTRKGWSRVDSLPSIPAESQSEAKVGSNWSYTEEDFVWDESDWDESATRIFSPESNDGSEDNIEDACDREIDESLQNLECLLGEESSPAPAHETHSAEISVSAPSGLDAGLKSALLSRNYAFMCFLDPLEVDGDT